MAEQRESNSLKVKIDVDCAEALKGLKAVTRAVKKATDALKALEEQMNKPNQITVSLNGQAVAKEITKGMAASSRTRKKPCPANH